MELPTLLGQIVLTIVVLGLARAIFGACDALIWKPSRLRSKLRRQGIRGPSPSFLLGNLPEMNKAVSQVRKELQGQQGIVHNSFYFIYPALEKWSQQYGSTFMFSLGNMQFLAANDPDVVKEIIKCTSLDFGLPKYIGNVLGPLLGKGILTSNGANWVHKRKTLAPALTLDSVKGMMNLMVESAVTLVDTWTAQIESEGGVAEIGVDKHLVSFTADVISKACFGSNYNSFGKDIFINIRGLMDNMSKRIAYLGIPLLRYLPTNSNREARRMKNEIRTLVLKAVQERKQAPADQHYSDLLQTILDGVGSREEEEPEEQFMVDNLKNIYLAGYETAATCAAWTLMLLASNPKWQERARAEVLEICGGQNPNADMVRKLKIVTMVLHESLRLYPPSPAIMREALQDFQFGDIHVPKGCHTMFAIPKLHQDPKIWGPNAQEFDPQRFANGVSGSCSQPQAFMPFGVGPRSCLGQSFVLTELKILFALILSKFSFTLSPKYKHSPIQELIVKPEYGITLVVKKL